MLKKIYKNSVVFLDKFLQTDSSFLMRGGFWSIFARISSSAILFGLSIIFARYLNKDIYGSYRYVLSLLGMASILTLPGIFTAYLRKASRDGETYIRRAIFWKFLLSFTTSLIGLGIAAYFFFLKDDTVIAFAVALASILSPLEEGTGGFISWLNLKQRFKDRAFYTIIYNLVFAFAMATAISAVFFYGINFATSLYILLTAYFLSKGIVKIIYLLRSIRKIPKTSDVNNEGSTIKYGTHLSLSTILVPIGTSIDSILLFSLLGPEALAVYSFAILVPEQAKGLITSFSGIIEPKIFSKSNESLKKLPKKILRASMPIFLGVALYFVLAPYIYDIFFPRYFDSALFSKVFAIALLSTPFSTALSHALRGKGNVKHIYTEKLSTQVLQIVSIAILIPIMGIWGAVLAKIVTRVYNALILIYLVRK